jgi:Flp pilus assembly protein TadD
MIRRIVVVALLALAVAGAAWFLRRGKKAVADDPVNPDPRLTYDTPFRNVRPDVQYVGSQACAACHEARATSYAQHPMGRSFAPIAALAASDRYDADAHNPFERFGNSFSIEREGSRVVHRVRRPGKGSEPYFDVAQEVAYVMGSGSHGRSYLINRDGRLYQSPISWYTQKNIWDVSPGYGAETLFDRPIIVLCLYCHSNHVQPVTNSMNRFHLSNIGEYAIGCERCHGPGDLHVREGGNATGPNKTDYTIVNPRKLEPALRDAVCEQCHLQGEARIVRRGRDVFDYRPGLPLQLFLSVFERLPELRDSKAVGQVEQMQLSKCYTASKGELGCISCHDPHVLPKPEEKDAYYRNRCQECHGQPGRTSCSAPPAEREKQKDACQVCHMPRLHASDIAHTAMSDHRVLRRLAGEEPPQNKRQLLPGEVPLVRFHGAAGDKQDGEVRRDLGVALSELAERSRQIAEPLSLLAIPLLDKAVGETPRDVPTLEARGHARLYGGRAAKALEDFNAVLGIAPDRERSLRAAAYVTFTLGKLDDSAGYSRRLLALSPYDPREYANYAQVLLRRRDYTEAVDASRAALRLNPVNVQARMLLIEALIRGGDRARAEAEFDAFLAASPMERQDELRRWHDSLR